MNQPIIITEASDAMATLRTARHRQGLSQQQVGDAADQTQSAIWKWETGRRTPHLVTLLRLADALGYDLALIPREDA